MLMEVPAMPRKPRIAIGCLHCKEQRAVKCRGICAKCFYTPGVRELYPLIVPKTYRPDSTALLSEAELDALIAEQMKCLPKWWKRETEEETERQVQGVME